MPGEGLKLAQAVTSSEIYDLMLHLREDMKTITDALVLLPGDLYPRKDSVKIKELLNKIDDIFKKLSEMAIRSGVTASIPEGAYFMKRKAILKDLLNRRVITKRRLNTCLTKCSDAYDNWAGSMVYSMFNTVWGATREGLKALTPLMHDYFVEEQPKDQTQSQPQLPAPQDQKKGKWGNKVK
jgi:hypothetical protein